MTNSFNRLLYTQLANAESRRDDAMTIVEWLEADDRIVQLRLDLGLFVAERHRDLPEPSRVGF